MCIVYEPRLATYTVGSPELAVSLAYIFRRLASILRSLYLGHESGHWVALSFQRVGLNEDAESRSLGKCRAWIISQWRPIITASRADIDVTRILGSGSRS